MTRFIWLGLVLAVGCEVEGPLGGPAPDPDDVARALNTQMYATCGDPACSGWAPKGLPRCRGREAGDVCDPQHLGLECDPHDACNATLVCSDTDPIDPLGGCPESRRARKKDITYVDPRLRNQLHDELMQVRLATYRYNEEAAEAPTHLGFIIDDVLPSPAVAANGERVDLYAYASMAVAALQVQSQQIAALEAQVRALQSEAGSAR